MNKFVTGCAGGTREACVQRVTVSFTDKHTLKLTGLRKHTVTFGPEKHNIKLCFNV